jgi:hypothetical protein
VIHRTAIIGGRSALTVDYNRFATQIRDVYRWLIHRTAIIGGRSTLTVDYNRSATQISDVYRWVIRRIQRLLVVDLL